MKRFLVLIFSLLCVSVYSQDIEAQGVQGLTYETYAGTGASPSISPLANPTVRSTGISANINFPAGAFGNNILGSGLGDRVIVKWTGFINLAAGTYSFGANADDGFIVNINGTDVVHSWIDSGNQFRSGPSYQFAAGVYPITVWYYENGGGQAITFQYWTGSQWAIVPSSMLATTSTYWTPQQPTLCCGGSSASFSINAAHQTKINTFVNRTPQDSKVSIEQIGNSNTITINQTGTEDNSVQYTGNGSFNTVTVNQSGNNNTVVNYAEIGITGNSNSVSLTQQSTGGTKSAFITVNNNNNTITATQKDSGSHYLSVSVSGGNKTVDVLQQGSANHMANISLSGNQTGLNLLQSGSQQQFYSINHTCSTAGGCGTITVQQGQ